MYKVLHYLFGWDYIYWQTDFSNGIARVFISHDWQVFYWKDRFLDSRITSINNPDEVLWLTCTPGNYFYNKVKK